MLAVIICTGIVVGLAAIYLVLRLTGALTTAAYRIALGERPSLAAAWQEGRLVVWPLVGLVGLLVVAYFAAIVAFIAIIGGIAVVGDSAGGAIAVVLMMFCAIPAMYWLMVKLSSSIRQSPSSGSGRSRRSAAPSASPAGCGG